MAIEAAFHVSSSFMSLTLTTITRSPPWLKSLAHPRWAGNHLCLDSWRQESVHKNQQRRHKSELHFPGDIYQQSWMCLRTILDWPIFLPMRSVDLADVVGFASSEQLNWSMVVLPCWFLGCSRAPSKEIWKNMDRHDVGTYQHELSVHSTLSLQLTIWLVALGVRTYVFVATFVWNEGMAIRQLRTHQTPIN